MSFLHPSLTVHVLCCAPACFPLCSMAGSGARRPGRPQWVGSSSLCRGRMGQGCVPRCMTGPQFCPGSGSGRERSHVESGREGRLSQGTGIPPFRCPRTPRPPPGSPLLNLSQPPLLCHHLLLLSLHMAREDPHGVALLISVGLWVRTEPSAGGPLTSYAWTLPRFPRFPLYLCDPASHCLSLASTFPAVKWG